MGRKKSIGIFDSGFGGLSVMRGIVDELPQYDYVFLADTARAPYGDRPQETIYAYTKQAMDLLFSEHCGIVIIACNTASSEALRMIQDEYGATKKVLGVLIPAAEEAVERTKNKRVGIIATEATVVSGKFIREIAKLDPEIAVIQQACPLLVPLIETGRHYSPEIRSALQEYLRPLLFKKIDTLILGCTHYGIIEEEVRATVGKDIALISETRVVPKKLADYLARHGEIEEGLGKNSLRRFFSTGERGTFASLGSVFYAEPITVESITLS